jgi:Uma2 family endonuclease
VFDEIVVERLRSWSAVSVDARLGPPYRFSLEEYHRLIDAGGFDEDARVELIEGLLLQMSPKSPEHENAISSLNLWLVRGLDLDRYEVRVSSPLTLSRSEPEPDLFVIDRDVDRPYHPATARLVIEVSVSSLTRDLRVKPGLYAAAGVDEYWVLDVDGRRLVVHRQPGPNGYEHVEIADDAATVAVAGLPLPPLAVAELLPPAPT